MKTVKDVMTEDVVWISPSARVRTAVILLKGHNIGALPVVEANDTVIGLLTKHDILGVTDELAVTEVMNKNFEVISPDTSIIDAAEIMQEKSVSHILVMEGIRLKGLVSESDLIPELGKTFDPLTELPWSDTFREWAVSALKHSMEICVIFFDLDQFGEFNKLHGHVVGDTVLKEVAAVLVNGIDAKIDCACRYGGDEFVVASLRSHEESNELAKRLSRQISEIHLEELNEKIFTTFGISGGRRTKERDDMHYMATVDDLVTRASKECISRKPKPVLINAIADQIESANDLNNQTQKVKSNEIIIDSSDDKSSRFRIKTVSLTASDVEVSVIVTLDKGGVQYSREVTGYVVAGKNTLRLVAEATAAAASKSLAPGYGFVVDDIILNETTHKEEVITVVVVYITPDSVTRMVGSSIVPRGDQFRAASAALLAAINRRLETSPVRVEEINEKPDVDIYNPNLAKPRI